MKFNFFYSIILSMVIIIASGLSCSAPATAPADQKNQPPVITQIAGFTDWPPVTEGELTCVASDPEGGELTYTWVADNGTIKGQGQTITWVSPGSMGKYNVSVTVADSEGLQSTMSRELRVIINSDGTISPDAPVVLNMVLPSKDVVTASKRIRIWMSTPVECKVENADNADLTYTWTPSNGKLQARGLAEGTASKVTWIAPGVAGDFTLDVVIRDSNGNEARGTVNFDVYCCGN